MKSYLKIYGPPLLKAIRALEKVAIGLPEVCIWDALMAPEPSFNWYGEDNYANVSGYFSDVGKVPEERCSTIISKTGESLGEYDFFFEWFRNPRRDEVNDLIEKIDEALTPLGVKYTLTTK